MEVDGSGHNEHAKILSDAGRTAYLQSCGYRVLRFWNNDVLSNTKSVMTVIFEALAEPQPMPPTPSPSPLLADARGGRGINRERRSR